MTDISDPSAESEFNKIMALLPVPHVPVLGHGVFYSYRVRTDAERYVGGNRLKETVFTKEETLDFIDFL